MRRSTFALLSIAAFGLVLASFVVLGLSRVVLPYRTARLLAAPFLFAGAGLFVVLLIQSVLAVTGMRGLED